MSSAITTTGIPQPTIYVGRSEVFVECLGRIRNRKCTVCRSAPPKESPNASVCPRWQCVRT